MTRTNTTTVNHLVLQNMKSINLPVKTKIALSESRSSNSSFPLLVTGGEVTGAPLDFELCVLIIISIKAASR